MVFILAYNYWQNSATINATLNDVVAKTKRASIDNAQNLINPVAATLELLASVAAEAPETFKKEESREWLYKALTSGPQIDAVYVSLEERLSSGCDRIDDDRRRSDPEIPATANWHSSYIDSFSGSPRRVRHRTFYDTWPHVVGSYDVGTIEDIRALAGYQAAKAARALIVEGPRPNPDTGFPVIILRVPIIKDGAFVGCASANITLLDVLSRFLISHRASPHSTTVIANPTEGTIIAYPDPKKGVRLENGRLEMAKLDTIDDGNVREAYRLQSLTNRDDFLFRSPQGGEEISASFTPFPGSLGKPWEVITLTPTDDFVGPLKRTNQQMIVLIAALTGLELLMIYVFSRRLARPIEGVSRDLRSGRRPDVLTRCPGVIKYQGDQGAANRRFAIRDLAALVLLFRAAGCGPKADQDRNATDTRGRTALPDGAFQRPAGVFQPRGANGTERSARATLDLF